jgi:hypothetical protein
LHRLLKSNALVLGLGACRTFSHKNLVRLKLVGDERRPSWHHGPPPQKY